MFRRGHFGLLTDRITTNTKPNVKIEPSKLKHTTHILLKPISKSVPRRARLHIGAAKCVQMRVNARSNWCARPTVLCGFNFYLHCLCASTAFSLTLVASVLRLFTATSEIAERFFSLSHYVNRKNFESFTIVTVVQWVHIIMHAAFSSDRVWSSMYIWYSMPASISILDRKYLFPTCESPGFFYICFTNLRCDLRSMAIKWAYPSLKVTHYTIGNWFNEMTARKTIANN